MCQDRCWQPPFCFPGVVLGVRFVVCPWPADSPGLSGLTSHLLKLACTAIRSVQGELTMGLGCAWVGSLECWGCLWASWWDPWARCPQRLVGRLLSGVCSLVSRICVPLTPSESPVCCPASLFLPPRLSTLTGAGEKWTSLESSHTAGGAGCLCTCSHPPSHGRNHCWDCLSWHWAVLPWERVMWVKSHQSSYLSKASKCRFFCCCCSSNMLELLHWTSGFPWMLSSACDSSVFSSGG